jgi:transcription initiation factor IIF auxiliary subunit
VTNRSFANANVSESAVENPPFEVTETGWGEFEIAIKVFFHPLSGEKSASLYHHLRLHPYEDDGTGQPWPKTKPVTSYQYDEIVRDASSFTIGLMLLCLGLQ